MQTIILRFFLFGRQRMDRTAFLLGHIIFLSTGCGGLILVGDILGFDVVAIPMLFIGALLYLGYSFNAMVLRFVDMGENPNYVKWTFFPGFGQLVWLGCFVLCTITPSKGYYEH